MKNLLITAVVLLVSTLAACDDVVLKPTKTGQKEIALVYIQGAQIEPERYVPIATAIQNLSPYTLWVGIPDYAWNVPLDISGGIERILKSMQQAGMNTTNVFYAGHSLGGAMLQSYLFAKPSNASGQILMGSYITRNHRNVTFPVPTITIGGELDGLCRVTRIMEEYYHRIIHAASMQDAIKNFPVTVIDGMSHMQFASGDPPELVKLRDLKPEISYNQAHQAIATLVSAFISLQLGDSSAFTVLSNSVKSTGTFLQPIVTAYELEGFYNFKRPCYNDPPSPVCTTGCPWTERAQWLMGGLNVSSLNDTDAFHPVDQINPPHLPHILNTCSTPGKSCLLKTATVSQCIYDEDKHDTGFEYTSASEIRAKLKARQAVFEAAGYKNVSFSKTDEWSICKMINQEAYSLALQTAASHTRDRFQQYGVPMVMGEDKGPYNAGPLWIWNPLTYKNAKNDTGGDILEIRSVMLRTPTTFFIEAAAGMHYCKLLSPARAMEWIYVDGLRAHYSI